MKVKAGTLCTECGFGINKESYVYSTYTHLFFCSDIENCRRRAINDLTWNEIMWLTSRVREESNVA